MGLDPDLSCLAIALGIFLDHGYADADGTVTAHEKLLDAVVDAMIEQWKRGWNEASESFAIRKKKGSGE